MLTALVLSAVTSNSAALAPLEFEARGERLDAVVERLAEVTGQPLVVGEEGAKHHLAIYAKSLTADELIAGIARVTVSQWIPDRGTMRLVPDRPAREAMRRERLKEKEEVFLQLVEGWKEMLRLDEQSGLELTPVSFEYSPFPRFENINQVLAGRMADRLIDYIDPQIVARMSRGDRVAFSTQPNARQVRFRPIPAALIRDLNHEYLEQVNELVEYPVYRYIVESTELRGLNLGLQDYITYPQPEANISKMLVVVTDTGSGPVADTSYLLRFIGFTMHDGRHKQMFTFNVELAGNIEEEYQNEEFLANLGMPNDVRLEPEVVSVLDSISEWTFSRRAFYDAPSEVQAYLLNRVANNPRKQVYYPYYKALADENEVDIVASIPEQTYPTFLSWRDGTMPFYMAVNTATDNVLERGTLYSIQNDVDLNVGIAIDDAQFETYLKRSSAMRSLSLRRQIEYIASRGNWRYDDPSLRVLRAVFRGTSFGSKIAEMTLLSYASAGELDRILEEGEIRFNSLNPEFRRAIERSVYNLELPLMSYAGPPKESLFEEQDYQMGRLDRYSYRVEPTELLPDGIPEFTVWSTKVYQDYGFLNDPQVPDATGFGGPFWATTLIRYTDTDSELGVSAAMQRPSRFFVGEMSAFQFHLRVLQDFAVEFSVSDMPVSMDTSSHFLHSMPEGVQQHINQIRQRMIESGRFNMRRGGFADPP